jgi:geranylgeranyl pyrophosphate synthase
MMWSTSRPCAGGRATANATFGNAASVLVGDFLYSRAFQMMVSVNRLRVLDVLADATNVIAEGEVLQLMNMHDPIWPWPTTSGHPFQDGQAFRSQRTPGCGLGRRG